MATVRNTAAIKRALQSISPSEADYLRLRRILMNFIVHEVAQRNYRAFLARKHGQPDEFKRRWVPLRPLTVAKKGHKLIGFERGRLQASFRPGYMTPSGRYIPGSPNQVVRITPWSLTYGTRVIHHRQGKRIPAASYFHYGTRNQQRRPFWRLGYVARWVRDGVIKGMPKVAAIARRSA
jgi:hypothetical protein